MISASDSGSTGLTISAFGKTDVGIKRENNQDSIFVSPDKQYFILSDGMGGHQGGEEASGTAIETIKRVFGNRDVPPQLDKEDEKSLQEISDKISRMTRAAILAAHQEVVKKGEEDLDLMGLGATIETLIIDDGVATIGHVGDSRIYMMHGGSMSQVTNDHSVLAEEMKRRKMTPKEIEEFPFKNRITRALGHLDDRRVDIHQYILEKDDLFLMCSDGLTDVASDDEIEKMLNDSKNDPQSACDNLVQAALDGGGPDNVSVIVVAVG